MGDIHGCNHAHSCKHADAVADLVVQGKSAEGELDKMAGGEGKNTVMEAGVQLRPGHEPGPPARPTYAPNGTPDQVGDVGGLAQDSQVQAGAH